MSTGLLSCSYERGVLLARALLSCRHSHTLRGTNRGLCPGVRAAVTITLAAPVASSLYSSLPPPSSIAFRARKTPRPWVPKMCRPCSPTRCMLCMKPTSTGLRGKLHVLPGRRPPGTHRSNDLCRILRGLCRPQVWYSTAAQHCSPLDYIPVPRCCQLNPAPSPAHHLKQGLQSASL
jgi:hypothetical protein